MRDTVSAAIEPMRPSDWPDVRGIYEEGIATGRATFETAAPEWEAWDALHRRGRRFDARGEGRGEGWCGFSGGARRGGYRGRGVSGVVLAGGDRGPGGGQGVWRGR